jgi:hypothetical protein
MFASPQSPPDPKTSVPTDPGPVHRRNPRPGDRPFFTFPGFEIPSLGPILPSTSWLRKILGGKVGNGHRTPKP